ncbi:hypothetical protein [Leuconostoc miyukkimchii]|uniref:hypothetical protein n=1 Tax=Leuconostoc miyukkimchii TaxID=910540 RepID=UPI001FEB818C|nr:hypothetical protein [Leuconostoc miyukkimchii]
MFINTLKDFGMTQIMSRNPTPVDNAPIKSFFHVLKANIVHLKQYESFHDFKVVVMPLLIITTINASSKNSMVCRRFDIGNSPLSLLVN